jgi:hypothetical protein
MISFLTTLKKLLKENSYKSPFFNKSLLLAVFLFVGVIVTFAQSTYLHTGTPATQTNYTHTISAGRNYIKIQAWGAGGFRPHDSSGQGGSSKGGGGGGYVEGFVHTIPGKQLNISVPGGAPRCY